MSTTIKMDCILLVDDDEATNFLTERVLKRMNIARTITTVGNGEEALNYLKKSVNDGGKDCPRPDLILLDLNMPLVNGWEFLELYRTLPDEFRNSVVIVMLTTSLRDQDRQRAELTGMVSGYVNKPLTEQDLRAILEQRLT